ncbi:chorismate mutase 1, chloroplastic-like [Oryza glaberrima]|uniref:chorismate mutase 1, chloroplastic-like n=1 Tax=Oryza glaberrima TaxID=4538 RepID=UPI00224C5B16|nr:chorismate mutase 1, chloroplastic-like [Oryza glaberrima]
MAATSQAHRHHSIAIFFHLQPPPPPPMELPLDKAAARSTPLALPAAGAAAAANQSPASLPLGPPAAASAKPLIAAANPPLLSVVAPAAAAPKSSSGAVEESKEGVEESNKSNVLTIGSIRSTLMRHEDTIIFGLLERSQFCYNPDTYDPNASRIVGFNGSLVEFMVKKTEKMHARMGRYKSPDEHPFFPENLLEVVEPSVEYENVLHPAAANININKRIWDVYFGDLLPRLVKEGSDGNCGSSACWDMLILQALSKRIHYGKYVAEAKFQGAPDTYTPAILNKDSDKLMELLTFAKVEDDVRARVMSKAMTFGQVVSEDLENEIKLKIEPELAVELYDKWIMPLTKEVQVQYLLKRLD